jgi:Ni/Co efflux regulator RcnB
MMKSILPAALVSLVAVSSAWAQPPAAQTTGLTQSAASLLAQVQFRGDRPDGDMRRGDDRRRFTPGRRYDNAPPGWRRHGNRRPGDWRTRGCIMAGPIWFCP